MVEILFDTMKVELLVGARYRTREQAKAATFAWIEVLYNRQRRHSTRQRQPGQLRKEVPSGGKLLSNWPVFMEAGQGLEGDGVRAAEANVESLCDDRARGCRLVTHGSNGSLRDVAFTPH